MKKSRLFICIMLSALCMATLGCKSHDDDDDDNPVTPTTTSLMGSTWRYDQGQKLTALINFSSQRFTVSITEFNYYGGSNSYETAGSYSYDGDVIEFTYDETTYKVWCTKKTNETTLAGTKWISETIYKNGRIETGTLEFFSDGSFYCDNFLGFYKKTKFNEDGNNGGGKTNGKNSIFYSYDGQNIKFTEAGEGTVSLQCGRILYDMAKNNTNIW